MPVPEQGHVAPEVGGPPPEKLPSASQLAWLMMRPEKALDAEQQQLLRRIRQDVTVERVYNLAKQFVQIVEERTAERLDGWLEANKESGIIVLQNFARSLAQDYGAVRAALETAWSKARPRA